METAVESKKKKKKRERKEVWKLCDLLYLSSKASNITVLRLSRVWAKSTRPSAIRSENSQTLCVLREINRPFKPTRRNSLFEEIVIFFASSTSFSHPVEWIQLLQTCLQCEMKTFSKQHQFATIISHDKDMNRSHNGYKQNTTNRWRQTQAFKICI